MLNYSKSRRVLRSRFETPLNMDQETRYVVVLCRLLSVQPKGSVLIHQFVVPMSAAGGVDISTHF